MKEQKQRAPYVPPKITDLGKVSVVTNAVGMSYLGDAAFTGSMFEAHPGMGMGM